MCGLPLKAITASALCGIDAAKSAKGVNTDQNNMTKQQKTLVAKLCKPFLEKLFGTIPSLINVLKILVRMAQRSDLLPTLEIITKH